MSKGFNYSTWANNINYTIIYEVRSSGLVGWGEATAKFNALNTAHLFARRIVGKPLVSVEKLLDPRLISGNIMYDWYIGFDRRVRQVREGFSFALYDLLGKLRKESIYKLIRRNPQRDGIPVMPVIHVNNPEQMQRIAESWTADGYHVFKVKLRGKALQDIEAVRRILRICQGLKIVVVDANYGYYDLSEVVLSGREIGKLGVSYFQNPIKLSLSDYEELSQKMGIPLTCDNTAYWPNIKRVIKNKAASLTNLHPNCMGGVDLLYRTVDYSASHGVPSIMGSSGFFGIQDRAYQKLAFTLQGDFPSEEIGMDPYFQSGRSEFYSYEFGLPELITRRLPIRNGRIYNDDCYGFGIEVDRGKLATVSVNRFDFFAQR